MTQYNYINKISYSHHDNFQGNHYHNRWNMIFRKSGRSLYNLPYKNVHNALCMNTLPTNYYWPMYSKEY